jgi:dual specificity protein kinase YAK1
MLDAGKQTAEFFNIYTDEIGRKSYRLKSLDQWRKEHPNQDPPEQPSKKYFQATTLPEIIRTYPMSRKSGKPADQQKETANRASFIDFISGLLIMDPAERWTPQQAKLHPFITGDKLVQPFKPPPQHTFNTSTSQRSSRIITSGQQQPAVALSNNSQYTNMSPASPGRQNEQQRYQDAAQYNQHIAQQQAYHQATAQRRQAQQALSNSVYGTDSANAMAAQHDAQQAAAAHQAAQQQAAAAAAATNPYAPMTNMPSPPQSGGYARQRSDTISRIDPATAAMSLGGAGTRASMNLNTKRDDWSSQPNGGILPTTSQHLHGGGMDANQQGWMAQNPSSPSSYSAGQLGGMGSYPASPLSGSGHGHSAGGAGPGSGFSVIVDGHDRRLQSSSSGGGTGGEGLSLGSAGGAIAPPPHAYSPAGGSSAGPRYSMQQPGQQGSAQRYPSSGSAASYDHHYDPTGAAHAAGAAASAAAHGVPQALLPNMQVKQYADDPQGQYGAPASNAGGGHLPTYHAHGGRY